MPRTLPVSSKWRILVIALFFLTPLVFTGLSAGAQRGRSAPQNSPSAQASQKKSIMPLSAGETPGGSRITITSDGALNDYSAYRSGDRFYVLIPEADTPRLLSSLRGRGFDDVRASKRGNDVVLSFRLLAGATARVNQKFNRLEIAVAVPGLSATTASTNANVRPQPTPSTGASNPTVANSNTRTPPGTVTTPSVDGSAVRPPDTAITRQSPSTSTTNPAFIPPAGIPVGPDGTLVQPGTQGFPPVAQTSPGVIPAASPPVDQIAQLQQTPGIPAGDVQGGTTTSAPAPASGTSLGAALKQNWLIWLLAVVVVGLIAWVLFTRSRAAGRPAEHPLGDLGESRAEAARDVTPSKAAVIAPAATSLATSALKPESVPVVSEPAVEAKSTQIEPPRPVAVDRAAKEVTNLLAGHGYEDAVIDTPEGASRQLIGAELLAALAGRNLARSDRAREAFIKHGYLDDATRTLRTSVSPAERASAARALGLVRDSGSTPHLVAALEDDSPEVRRAAVESLAEVRDPAAVAPLEALRDREKDRKVSSTVIQHAIEASVVGRRAKEGPISPVVSSYSTAPLSVPITPVTSPLIVDPHASPTEEVSAAPAAVEPTPLMEEAVAEAVVQPQDVEPEPPLTSEEPPAEPTQPSLETEAAMPQPIAPVIDEVSAPVVEETPISKEFEPVQSTEMEVAEEIAASPSQAGMIAPVPEETPAPVVTAEQPMDDGKGVVSGWVDVDVTAPESDEVAAPATAQTGIEPVIDAQPAEASIETYEAEVLEATAAGIFASGAASETAAPERGLDVSTSEKEIEAVDERSTVPTAILRRLAHEEASERAAGVSELGVIGGEDAFREISASFDDPAPEVRDAAARALFNLNPDRAASFTRALREAPPERRRHIGAALASSGLASEAISHLMGESREKTYDAFSLLFLMSKAGELQPLMRAVEEHPNNEVRLAVVKLLALSGQQEILPAFRRLAVRGSLPTDVRSAVMEAIYQISSQSPDAASRS